MEISQIIFRRARSFDLEDVTTIFANHPAFKLDYGEPFLVKSNYYSSFYNTYLNGNHFFVNGDSCSDSHVTPQETKICHVGPYWSGGNGIAIDNSPDSRDLGKVSVVLTAGNAVTIANGNSNDKVISSVTPTYNGNMASPSTLHTLTADAVQTLELSPSTEREYHIVDCSALSQSLAGVFVTLTIAYPDTNVSECYVLFKNIPSESQGLSVNIGAVTSNGNAIANVVKPVAIAFKNGYIELCCKQIAPTASAGDIHAVFTYITHLTS